MVTKTENEIYDTWPESICEKEEVLWFEKRGFEELKIDGKWKNSYNLLIVFKTVVAGAGLGGRGMWLMCSLTSNYFNIR